MPIFNSTTKPFANRNANLFQAGFIFWSLTFTLILITCVGSQISLAEDEVVASADEEGFVSMFDGKDLKGWKINETPKSWTVEDGCIVANGDRSHLFYIANDKPFKNFHFKGEVMTTPDSNSGIYFHTRYQDSGWPKYGFECQVNISHSDPKKTSGLYSVQDVFDPPAKDNQWYTQEIIVVDRRITLKVDGKTVIDYTEPENKEAADGSFERRLGEGTFALQAHDPKSKVFFRNLRVKRLD